MPIELNPHLLSGANIFPIIKELLDMDNEYILTVTGNSMWPFLTHCRDSVLLIGKNNRTIRRGEIVLIKRDDNSYVMHRIYKIIGNGFLLNGDSQNWTEAARKDQIIAFISCIYRKEKVISCDSFFYRILVWSWMLLLPVRPSMISLYKRILKFR